MVEAGKKEGGTSLKGVCRDTILSNGLLTGQPGSSLYFLYLVIEKMC